MKKWAFGVMRWEPTIYPLEIIRINRFTGKACSMATVGWISMHLMIVSMVVTTIGRLRIRLLYRLCIHREITVIQLGLSWSAVTTISLLFVWVRMVVVTEHILLAG